MKKKIIYGMIAIILSDGVVFAYIQMSGNQFEKNRAKERLETFLDQAYPDMQYEIICLVDYAWFDATFRFTFLLTDEL